MSKKDALEWQESFLERRRNQSFDLGMQLDKTILTLSSGALGISLTFLKDILRPGSGCDLLALRWSWYSFGVAILCTVGSGILTHLSIIKSIEEVSHLVSSDPKILFRRSANLMEWNNYVFTVGLIAFMSGVGLTIRFVSANLPAVGCGG